MWKLSVNLPVFLRILIGILLLTSGFQKALLPYQNFQYVIQGYKLFPPGMETAVAMIVPWIELFTGLFLVLGLHLRLALGMAIGLFGGFMMILAQALLRGIALEECGCFGKLFSVPPLVMLLIDSIIFLTLCVLFRRYFQTSKCSLDSVLK